MCGPDVLTKVPEMGPNVVKFTTTRINSAKARLGNVKI